MVIRFTSSITNFLQLPYFIYNCLQDANLNLLPHAAAPGSNVLTTTTATVSDGYTVMSGTSHATPYMSGGLALLLQLEREQEESEQGVFK